MFGACGFHVPVCALAFLMKHGLQSELALLYTRYFILPALILFWIFFAVLEITHITAFARGATPYPKMCLIFSIPIGMLIAYSAKLFGNFPLCKRPRLCVDCFRQYMDVRRSACVYEKNKKRIIRYSSITFSPKYPFSIRISAVSASMPSAIPAGSIKTISTRVITQLMHESTSPHIRFLQSPAAPITRIMP